jgi:hypothetical protein
MKVMPLPLTKLRVGSKPFMRTVAPPDPAPSREDTKRIDEEGPAAGAPRPLARQATRRLSIADEPPGTRIDGGVATVAAPSSQVDHLPPLPSNAGSAAAAVTRGAAPSGPVLGEAFYTPMDRATGLSLQNEWLSAYVARHTSEPLGREAMPHVAESPVEQ